jgi:excisionase family DNA binding protein
MKNNRATVWLTRKHAADRAGVHPRTIDYWRKTGRLTTHRTGTGAVRIDQQELDDLTSVRPEQQDRKSA